MNNGTILLGGGGYIEYLREISASFTPADPVTGSWKRYFRGTGLYVEEDTAFRQYRIRLRRANLVTVNTTIVDPTHDTVQVDATSGNITITLPDPSDITYGNRMKVITIQKQDSSANAVIIDGAALGDAGLAQRYVLSSQYQSVTFVPFVDASGDGLGWIAESAAPGAGPLRDLDTQGTTAVTSEEDLNSIVVPAHVLNGNFVAFDVEVFGSFANNTNTKTARLKIGSTTLISNDVTTAPQDLKWIMKARIYRTGVSAQKAVGEMLVGANPQTVTYQTLTFTETAAQTVKVTGQNGTASANDVVCEGLIVRPVPY